MIRVRGIWEEWNAKEKSYAESKCRHRVFCKNTAVLVRKLKERAAGGSGSDFA